MGINGLDTRFCRSDKLLDLRQIAARGGKQNMGNEQTPDRLLGESNLLVQNLAKSLPHGRGSRSIHPGTLRRWIHKGVRGVRLEAVRLGGRWMTSYEAVERFMAALTNTVESPAPVGRSPTSRLRAISKAERLAEAQGF
jgi:hypothetical protein